jgi:hypothetical protein
MNSMHYRTIDSCISRVLRAALIFLPGPAVTLKKGYRDDEVHGVRASRYIKQKPALFYFNAFSVLKLQLILLSRLP